MNDPWIYIVLLGAFAIVCALALPRKTNPEGDGRTIRNMEVALEQFMENMEAENKELIESVAKARNEWNEDSLKRENKIVQLERRCSRLEQTIAAQESKFEKQFSLLREELNAVIASTASQTIEPSAVYKDEGALKGQQQARQDGEAAVPSNIPLIRTRYAELFKLHDQGKSIEFIARKSGLNKGEVQLILQLSRQEEEHRV